MTAVARESSAFLVRERGCGIRPEPVVSHWPTPIRVSSNFTRTFQTFCTSLELLPGTGRSLRIPLEPHVTRLRKRPLQGQVLRKARGGDLFAIARYRVETVARPGVLAQGGNPPVRMRSNP